MAVDQQVTREKFIESLYAGLSVYTKKNRSWVRSYISLEDKLDPWFFSLSTGGKKGAAKERRGMITRPEVEMWCNDREREGHLFYLES